MSRERAELSKKNPYHIPRYRYYELKYFCRQYDDWKKALTLIDGWQTSPNDISGIIKGCPPESPTERIALSRVFYSSCMEGCLPKNERRNAIMAKRVKTNYDRGYVNAMDKIRVFIESSLKVMYVDTREYKNAETARCAYRNAIALVRAGGIVRVTCNRNELFLIRNDI